MDGREAALVPVVVIVMMLLIVLIVVVISSNTFLSIALSDVDGKQICRSD